MRSGAECPQTQQQPRDGQLINRPLESIAETQPKLQPRFLRLSAMGFLVRHCYVEHSSFPQNSLVGLHCFFWRERSDNFFKARVAAEGVESRV